MTKRLRKPIRKAITVMTSVFAGLTVFQIVPIEAEENSFEATVEEENEKLEVRASAPSGTLSDQAKLVVTPVKNDGNDSLYEDTLNKLNEEAQKENKAVDAFIAYDIQFEKDGKEVEPSNGNVNVNLKWENPVKPEGVQENDQISVIHLRKDGTTEDLTEEKDETKNHATAETDEKDLLSLKAVTLQSDSFSIYTVVWTRSLDNQTDASASPAATAAPDAADNTEVQLPTAENDEYSVNVSYNKSEVTNIPDDAYVTVESYADDSAEYNTAREAVIAQKQEDDANFDESSLGMKAFDISIHSPSDPTNEIEPDGKVSVSITLKKLPEDVQKGDSLDIQHIVSDDVTDDNAANTSDDTDQSQVKAETVATDVKAEDGATASFETDSFSTYTVQWESDQDGADDNYYRSLNGRTVMIVFQKGDKYYALSSDYQDEEAGYLKMVEVTPSADGKTFNVPDDEDHANIYWRFTTSGAGATTYFIESVKKGGIAKEDGHKNDFTYLKNDDSKSELNNNVVKGYGISIVPNNGGRLAYQVVKVGTDNKVRITTTAVKDDNTPYSLNVAGGKPEDGVHLWNNNDSPNAQFTLYDVDTSNPNIKDYSIKTIDTVDSIKDGISITMFDYTGDNDINKTDPQYENNGQNQRGGEIQNQYILNQREKPNTNDFTQGIVENKLGADGYPKVATTSASSTSIDFRGSAKDDAHSTLKGLFSSDYGKDAGTTAYTNVNKLFSQKEYDDTGYYVYNCFKNYAYFDQSEENEYGGHDFKVYDQIGTPLTAGYYGSSRNDTSAYQRGNFMPYNDLYKTGADGKKTNQTEFSTFTNEFDENDNPLQDSKDPTVSSQAGRKLYKSQGFLDYYFGMKMEMDFVQPEGGKVPSKPGSEELTDMVYEFNGDDDLWVYIDDALALDIGGIHGACHGKIDFATGKVTYISWENTTKEKKYNTNFIAPGMTHNNDGTYSISLRDCFHNANVLPDGSEWTAEGADKFFNADGTFKDFTKHHLKMFYMERGAGASDLDMRFNLQSIKSGEFTVRKHISNADAAKYADQPYKFTAYYKENIATSDEDGKKLTKDVYDGWNTQSGVYEKLDYPYITNAKTGANEGNITFNTDGSFNLTPDQVAHFPLPQDNDYYCVQEAIDPNKYECSSIADDEGRDATSDSDLSKSKWYESQNNKFVLFTNTMYEQNLKLVKVDSSGNKKLVGAKFTLKNGTGNESPYLTNDQLETYVKKNGSDAQGVFSTNGKTGTADDGVIALPVGTYILQETKAPDGYNLSNTTWTIIVKKPEGGKTDGVTITPSADGTNPDKANGGEVEGPTGTNNLYTVSIHNSPGAELPKTGGRGTIVFYLLGGAIVILAIVMIHKKNSEAA